MIEVGSLERAQTSIAEKSEMNSPVLRAFSDIKKQGMQLDDQGIKSYESGPFELQGRQCRLRYSFQRSPESGVYATVSTQLQSLTGEQIVEDTIRFGEVSDNELVIGSSIQTAEPFRRQGFGSAAFHAREDVIQTTIDSYHGFQGKTVSAAIFDAADIPGWSSVKAQQNGYKQVGENIWTKTYTRTQTATKRPVLHPLKLVKA